MEDNKINIPELLKRDISTLTREELTAIATYNAGKIMKENNKIAITINKTGYAGEFVFRHPSLMDEITIAVKQSELSQGKTLSGVMVNNIVYMYATLIVVKEVAPDWFNLEDMKDYAVLEEIYNKYSEEVEALRTQPSAEPESNDE